MKRRILISLVCALVTPISVFAQYAPPVGIPAPPFGVNEVAPAVTQTVNYLPASLAPGDVVQLTGTIGGGSVQANCTAAKPCWLIATGAKLTGYTYIGGSYVIGVDLNASGANSSIELGASYAACRGCQSHGDPSEKDTAGLVASGHQVVFYHWLSENHGTIAPNVDTDAHGASAVRGSTNVWFIDGESRFNAGDGVNCNSYPYDASGFTAISGVFIGRNYLHDNKQTGQWCKQSQNVVVSQNWIANSKAVDQFSYGQCAGYQYGTDDIWFLYNRFDNCDAGIGISGDLGGEPTTRTYNKGKPVGTIIIGNAFTNIVGTSQCGQGGGVWNCAPVFLTGGAGFAVINNSFPSLPDSVHATRDHSLYVAGSTGNNIVLTDGPTPPAPTAAVTASVFGLYTTLFGVDVTTGTPPASPSSVGLGTLAPSPTPVPSATPSPKPTATPSPSPKPTATPSPTPTPAPAPLPACPSNPLLAWLYHLLGKC